MNFKDWYSTADRNYRGDDFIIPYITIKDEVHYGKVIEHLTRLGFLDGNDFSKYGIPVTTVDIWYNDFWNSHIAEMKYEEPDLEFEFLLEDIENLPKRVGF